MNDWIALPLVVIVFLICGVFVISVIVGGFAVFQHLGRKLPRPWQQQ